MTFTVAALLLLVASTAADCPPGSIYESYFNKCYQFFSTPMSFLDAEQQCNSIGGHLSDVQNSFENSYISGIASGASSKTPNFWIGANLLRSSSWSWTSTTSLLLYSNWAIGQPVNSNSCAYVKDSGLNWITLPCNTQLPFMCTISPNATVPGFCPTQAPSPTCASTGCPADSVCTNGYTLYSGNCMCYKYYQSTAIFSDANATCSKDGGMLAKIESKDVNDFLTALPGADCAGATCPFIGLTCTSNTASSCKWVDGSPLGNYTNFNSGPVALPFVLVTNTRSADRGKWEGQNDGRHFMCQKDSIRASLLLEKKDRSGNMQVKTMTSKVVQV